MTEPNEIVFTAEGEVERNERQERERSKGATRQDVSYAAQDEAPAGYTPSELRWVIAWTMREHGEIFGARLLRECVRDGWRALSLRKQGWRPVLYPWGVGVA